MKSDHVIIDDVIILFINCTQFNLEGKRIYLELFQIRFSCQQKQVQLKIESHNNNNKNIVIIQKITKWYTAISY